MDLDAPKSEPEKSYEKPNTEKAEKDEIASKPDDTPKKIKQNIRIKKSRDRARSRKTNRRIKLNPER